MKKSIRLIAASLAALILPGVLAAQNQPAGNPSQPQAQQPAPQNPPTPPPATPQNPPSTPSTAVTPAAPAVSKAPDNAPATEASEKKALKEKEKADIAAIKAKQLSADDEAKQIATVKKDYAQRRHELKQKYHPDQADASKDAKPAK